MGYFQGKVLNMMKLFMVLKRNIPTGSDSFLNLIIPLLPNPSVGYFTESSNIFVCLYLKSAVFFLISTKYYFKPSPFSQTPDPASPPSISADGCIFSLNKITMT